MTEIKGVHRLKTLPEYYALVAAHQKPFEIRRNDRDFQVGDLLILQEWSPENGYTHREEHRFVTCVVDYEQKPGFVVMGLKLAEIPT